MLRVWRAGQMDLRQEIAKRVETLPGNLQERVLEFVAALSASATVGERGLTLGEFSSSLDPLSARQMLQAIEEECERVDPNTW